MNQGARPLELECGSWTSGRKSGLEMTEPAILMCLSQYKYLYLYNLWPVGWAEISGPILLRGTMKIRIVQVQTDLSLG